jgi:xylulokinase
MPLVAGVDSSTQSCTVVLRDADDGRIVGHGRAAHPPTTPPVSEQAPMSWWMALQEALSIAKAGDIAALSVDGQGHGLVALDDHRNVIRPAKLWNDTTSSPEASELVEHLGAATWARRTGSVPVAAFTITKLLWLKRHEPESFQRLALVLLPHDWLTFRLTGSLVTDRGDASHTGYFSPAESAWQTDLLALVDDTADWASRLPRVLGPEDMAGTLTREAAVELELSPGAAVGPGTGDNMASALGIGLQPGDVAVSLGTSGVVFAGHTAPTADATGAVNGNADATGAFLPLLCTLNAAKVTDAFARLLGVDHDTMTALALAAPPTPDRPVLAAYLDGERVPNRPGASGLLAGLRSDTTREQVARAAYEGVIAGLLAGINILSRLGVRTDGRLILTGGGARSAAYRQLMADLSGRPIYTVDLEETAAAGAAIQAAAVLHSVKVAELADVWAPTTQLAAEPRPDPGARELLDRYRRLSAWRELDRSPVDENA